ncbi:MAG: ComEC family competence protein, partial [Acetobacteraceae bacterium]|nr:ComEC family competence protein [Acetobacteraceae bacterium]
PLATPSGPHPACGAAPVLLSPEPLRGRCAASVVVDRFSVWRDGAHAVLADGRVLSDRAHRGDRRWVPPRPLPRGTSQEPPAETE